MNPIVIHPIIWYSLFSFSILFMIGCCIFMWMWLRMRFYDILIFIDRNNRWNLIFDKIRYSDTYTFNDKKYFLTADSSILNRRGKAMYIFSENKPSPMRIKYNDAKWLTSETMQSIINNKLIQKLVQPSNSFADSLLLFGAIGGMIAGLSTVIILLKTFGVF